MELFIVKTDPEILKKGGVAERPKIKLKIFKKCDNIIKSRKFDAIKSL